MSRLRFHPEDGEGFGCGAQPLEGLPIGIAVRPGRQIARNVLQRGLETVEKPLKLLQVTTRYQNIVRTETTCIRQLASDVGLLAATLLAVAPWPSRAFASGQRSPAPRTAVRMFRHVTDTTDCACDVSGTGTHR